MIHPEKLGSRIAACRKSLGLTQGQVAARMGVSPQAVSKWERGLACPDLIFFDELCDCLHTDVESLLLGKDMPEALSHSA